MFKPRYLALSIGIALLYQNCSPFESLDSSGMRLSETAVFSLTCAPNDPRQPTPSQLKPLNAFELENTLHDLFEPHLSTTQRDQFRNRLRPLLAELPKPPVSIGMAVANHGVTLVHVERHFLIAESVA